MGSSTRDARALGGEPRVKPRGFVRHAGYGRAGSPTVGTAFRILSRRVAGSITARFTIPASTRRRSFVSRSERAAHVRQNGQRVKPARVSPHIRINNHRRVPVERARALYRIFGDWHKVAEALPGNFRWFSIQTAVRRAQRG